MLSSIKPSLLTTEEIHQQAIEQWKKTYQCQPLPTDVATLQAALKAAQIKQLEAEIAQKQVVSSQTKVANDHLRVIFNGSNDAIIILQNDRFIDCNPKALEMFGIPDKAVLKTMTPVNISPEFQPDGTCSKASVAEKLQETTEKGFARFEWVHKKFDGSIFSTIVSLSMTQHGTDQFIHAIITDITQIKQFNQVIKEREELEQTKRQIEENATRLKEAQAIAHIGHWSFNISTDIEVWSDELYRIVEIQEGDIVPSEASFLSFIHPDDKEPARTVYQSLNNSKKLHRLTYRLLLKNGKIKYIRERCQGEFDENNVHIRSIGTIQDITEKVLLEQELELANKAELAKLYQQQSVYINEIEAHSAELDRFFDLSLDIICVITPDGYIKRTNPTFLNILGYTLEELSTKPLIDFVHPDDIESTYSAVMKVNKGEDILDFENRYRTKSGEYRWISWRAVLDKKTSRHYAIARDVTEEKITQKKVEDLTYTLNQVAIVMIVDKDEKILAVNDKFCEISGYGRQEVIGKHHEILDSLHHPPEFWEDVRTTIEGGNIWQGEIKERAKDGSFYWTDTSSVPFLDDEGNPFQYIVIQSNITAKKQLEKDLRQAKEIAIKNAKIKEDFLANMSHEIRTPMNGILGFSRLLLQTAMNATQINFAQSIYSSAENLLVIINDILDVAKIESGKFQLYEVPFDLRDRVQRSLDILQLSIKKKQLKLYINIDPAIPQTIISSPDRISQVLINLISNAIKFTKEGFIRLSITLQGNQALLFEVQDTGIGIPTDKLDAIFESFTQVESYTTREYSGTGLGLSICKKLVQLMGGKIGVDSTINQGAKFYFSLPFKTPSNTDVPLPQADKKFLIQPELTKGISVLIVEDNLVNQELAIIYLKLLKCQYDLANNGEEALLKLQNNTYDLILMDIQMPKMDGITATQKIRASNLIVPIIAMTAHTLPKEKEKCFDIGMNDYISKPFKIETLQAIITKHASSKPGKPSKPDVIVLDTIDLNLDNLNSLTDGNQELGNELLGLFKIELMAFQQNMESAIKANDKAIIKKHIHKIKPNFELLQLNNLYELSSQITAQVNQDASIEAIKTIYQQIKQAIPNLIKSIDKVTKIKTP